MAAHNKEASGLETVMIPAVQATRWLSSTVVRSLAHDGRYADLENLVPPAVLEVLRETFALQQDTADRREV